MRYLLSIAALLLSAACGNDDSMGPSGAEFPRAFSSTSEVCTKRMSLNMVGEFFEETTLVETTEASSEVLFAGAGVVKTVTLLDRSGTVVAEEITGQYRPAAADGLWDVQLSPEPDPGSFTAQGTGTGDLSSRSIDFRMEPLPGGCGYRSTGTIR